MSGLGMQNSLFALGIIEKYTNVSPSLVESPSLVFLQSQPAEEEQGVFANVLMEFSVLLQQLSTDRENVWIGNPRIFLENIFQNLSYYQSFLNKNTFFSSATQQNNTTVVNKQIYAIQRQISTMRQILYENAHHTTAVSQQTTAATIQHILQQYLQLSSPTLPNDQIRSRSPQINIKNTVFKTDQNNYTANRFYTQQQKNSYKTNALSVQQLSTQQTLRIGPPVVSSVQHLSWNKESKRSVFSRFDAKIYHHQNAFIALHDTKKDEAFFLSAQKYDIYRVQKNIELIRRVFGWETNFFQQFMPNLVENTAQQNHVTQNLAVWYHQIQQHNAQRLYKSNAFFEAYNQNILQHYASKLSQSGDTVEILNNSVFTKLLHLHNSENGRNLPFESFIYPSLVQKVGGFVKEQQVIHKTDPAISNDAKPNYILKYDTEPPQKQGAVYQIRSQNPVSTISNLFTTTFSAVPNQQKDILPLMQYVRSERTEKETAVSAVPTLSLRSGENRILPVVADQARGKAETVWNRYSMQQQAWNVFASRNDWSTQNVFYPMTVQQMQAVQQGLPNPFYKREWLLPVSYRESFVRNRELLQRVTEKTNSEAYHISLQQNLVQENRRETIVVSEKSGTTNVIPKAAQNAVMAETVSAEKPAKETAVPTAPTTSFRSRESGNFPVVADQARGKAETVLNRYSMQQQAWNVFASRNDWSTQNVFYPMTVQQMQAVQQGLPNPFYKREWLLPVSYRESFVRNRELLQRVTEKTNSEAYHISLQQNLVQENRRETIVVSEKSGTTNVIPKAAQNAVMAETVSAEKPAKETAVPTAPTTSFRSRESGNFPVVADQARGKAETVLNRYSMQQQAWNVFASRNEWSTQNVFYPMTVRQMQAVQQGLPNPFHRKESLLPVSHRERFVRERELLQRVTEKTNNAVYHFTIGHIQHQVTPSTSQNFVKRDRDSSKDNQKWSVSNKQPAINNGQNIFYDEKSFVMVPYLQITPLLGQFPTLTTRHTETHTLFKNSIATTHKISEQAKQSFSLKNFVGKSVQSSAQQRQPKTAALPQRSVLNAQKIDVPTVIFQKQAEKMHGTLSPSRASERSNEKSVPLPSVQPSRFTYPQTAAAQTAHRTTTFTPKHSTLPLAERKQPSANLPTSKLNPQKQNTEKNVTLLKKTLETQQQWSKFLVELEKSGASLVGNGVKELFSRNEFHRINQVMQQNVLVKMQNTTAYRNLLPSTNKITTIHHHLSVRSTAVEAAGVQASTLRNRSGSSPFSYPDRGELSYRRTTQKQDAPPQQPTIEAQIQLRTIKKVQTEQAQGLEQQTGALKKLEKQLKQQEEQITQLMRRNSVSEPKIPSSHQLADQIMKEIQRQMRLERQRRGG